MRTSFETLNFGRPISKCWENIAWKELLTLLKLKSNPAWLIKVLIIFNLPTLIADI
jgi:hypothetical protein